VLGLGSAIVNQPPLIRVEPHGGCLTSLHGLNRTRDQ